MQSDDVVALRAALQRQEALSADVAAHDDRVGAAAALGEELLAEKHNLDKVGPGRRNGRARRALHAELAVHVAACAAGPKKQVGNRPASLRQRHVAVDERLRQLRVRLSNDLLASTFSRDADAIESFIDAKMPLATSKLEDTNLSVRLAAWYQARAQSS